LHMKDIVRQLRAVGALTRWLLIAQRLSQAVAVALGVFLALALLDYVLVLPGLVRLLAGVGLVGAGVFWLARRMSLAARVNPGVTELALYAERLHPELTGRLAAGVDFYLFPERYASPEMTGAMRDASMVKVNSALEGVKLKGLIDPKPTLKLAGVAGGVVLLMAVLAVAMPAYAGVAVKRWALPWMETPWPSQHMLESGMGEVKVWPSDQPVRLRASVAGPVSEKPKRVRAHYRWRSDDGGALGWQSVIMNRATGGSDRVDPYESLILMPPSLASAQNVKLDFSFDMSQQVTGQQVLALIQRPAVVESYISLEPPAYAKGLVSNTRLKVEADGSGIGAASGLVGSQVKIEFRFNKPLSGKDKQWQDILPGLAQVPGLKFEESTSKHNKGEGSDALSVTFTLAKSVESAVRLKDEHGLESQSEQVWRVDAVTDQMPTVAMLKPIADESVLATALVPLEAGAQDDVAIEEVGIEMTRQSASAVTGEATVAPVVKPKPVTALGGVVDYNPKTGQPDGVTLFPIEVAGGNDTTAKTPSPAAAVGVPVAPRAAMIASNTGRAGRLSVTQDLDLASQDPALKPGDVLTLVGVACDNYVLDGKRHDAARSAPRQIRIIDEAALVAQIRGDMTGLRQAAARTDATEAQAQSAKTAKAAQAQQDEVSRRLQAHQTMLRQIQARIAMNRLQDTAVQETVSKVQASLEEAQKADDAARKDLGESAKAEAESKTEKAQESHEQAKENQAAVRKALTDLMNAVDQGRDTLAVQSQIQQMLKDLQNTMAKTQEMMPKTMGKRPEDLTKGEKEALNKVGKQQEDLAKRSEALTRQMQSAAQELARQESPESQASAQAMNDSAQTAREENLTQSLDKGSESTQKNQLSQASAQQKQAQKTLEKMLEKLQEQEKIKRELLQRKLMELVEKVKRLIEAQKNLNEETPKAKALAMMDAPQSEVRGQGVVVVAEARENPLAAKAVGFLLEATVRQADAIRAIRAGDAPATTTGQQQALAQLMAALAELEKQAKPSDSQDDDEKDKLKAAYLALAKEQGELVGKVKPFTGKETLTRKERADAFEVAKAQDAVRAKAAELGVKVQNTLTFKAIHKVIDKSALKAVSGLKLNPAEVTIPGYQTDVKEQLEAMAQALEDAQRKEDFEEKNPGESGGGSGGGKKPLIPPVAELRLLRQMQKSIIRQTVAAEAGAQQARAKNDPAGMESHKSRALELSLQQRELSGIGEELINKLTQQGGGQ
jgi:hypothetical protein